jgi:hypothetical protein
VDWYDQTCYATEILDAKYEKVEIDEVINQLNHLTLEKKEDLRKVLKEHTKIFDGTLGVYPHKKIHIDLVPGAISKHARPYPVPVIHLNAFKKELLYLVEIGVLSLQGASEYASPMFITPPKDGRVCWVSDLWELNKVVKRKQYSLPIMWGILCNIKDNNSLLCWTSQCNVIPLNLTMSQRTYAPLQHPLVNSNTNITYGSYMFP